LIFVALLKKAVAAVLAVVGLLSIIVAGFSGLDFTNGGYSNGAESFIMAVAFLAAILLYVNLGRLIGLPEKQSGKMPLANESPRLASKVSGG
jgi:hypothetical protein